MAKWYNDPEIIKWVVVILITIAVGVFIFTSKVIPEKYIIGLAIADYIVFTYANFKIISLRNKQRQKANQVNENRAARRQAERLKNK